MNKSTIVLALSAISLLAESKVIDLSPISVVGTGIEESVLEQPLSVATKGEEEVKLDQVIFQKDLLNSLSGVHIEQTGSVIGHTTAIRMPENKSSYYLFMQDGIPVQSSGFFNHNGLAYTTFQTATSVEVLKGAGTALYGSDAVAAVINVESLKKPSKEKETTVKGMVGSDGYRSGSVEMSDTVDEKSSYRANVGYMHSDGWRENTDTDRFEANIRYDHILDDNNDLKIMFYTSVTDAQQAGSFSDYANIENGSTDASDSSRYDTALTKTDIKRQFDYARLSVEWNNYSYDGLEISLTPYVRYNRNRYVQTWYPYHYPLNDNELKTVGLLEKNIYETSWGKIITGFDAEYTESSLKYTQLYDTSVFGKNYVAGPIFDYDVSYMAIAPYVHTEYDITQEITLTAGLRYDYNHYDYNNNLQGGTTDPSTVYYRPEDKTDDFSHLSPKLALSYQPTKDMNLYLRYANGFNIPQASRLYSMKNVAGYTSVTLDAETTNTYEIGMKKYFGTKSYAEIAFYHMDVDDIITQDSTTKHYYNGNSGVHRGIETTAQVQMTDDWAARVAYSYSKHNYENDPTYGNNEMAIAPNSLANARLIYTPSYLTALRAMIEWQHVGSYWKTNDNDAKYSGYDIGNLKIDYAYNEDISVFGKVTNITDKRYAVSASDDYTPGDPRQFYAGLEYRW